MKGQVCIRGEGFSGLDPDVVLGLFDAMGSLGWGGVDGRLILGWWLRGISCWGEFVCIFVEHECSIAKGARQVLRHAELEEEVCEIWPDVEGEGGVVVAAEGRSCGRKWFHAWVRVGRVGEIVLREVGPRWVRRGSLSVVEVVLSSMWWWSEIWAVWGREGEVGGVSGARHANGAHDWGRCVQCGRCVL